LIDDGEREGIGLSFSVTWRLRVDWERDCRETREEADVADEDVVEARPAPASQEIFIVFFAVDEGVGREFEEESCVLFILEKCAQFFVVEANGPGLLHVALVKAEGLFGVVFV